MLQRGAACCCVLPLDGDCVTLTELITSKIDDNVHRAVSAVTHCNTKMEHNSYRTYRKNCVLLTTPTELWALQHTLQHGKLWALQHTLQHRNGEYLIQSWSAVKLTTTLTALWALQHTATHTATLRRTTLNRELVASQVDDDTSGGSENVRLGMVGATHCNTQRNTKMVNTSYRAYRRLNWRRRQRRQQERAARNGRVIVQSPHLHACRACSCAPIYMYKYIHVYTYVNIYIYCAKHYTLFRMNESRRM